MRDHREGRRVLSPLAGLACLAACLAACADGSVRRVAVPEEAAAMLSARTSDDDGLPVRPGAHVLLVTVDALRADRLGVYGYERGITPGIDAWARHAVVFERAYAQAPHSSWSLCSLMTGEYLHEIAKLDAAVPEATLASTLGDAGYRTVALFTEGIFYTDGDALADHRRDRLGFEEAEHENPDAAERTERALEIVDQLVDEGEPPTLFWVHYFDPHEPYTETSLGTSLADRYDGEVRNADDGVARLIAEMRWRLTRDVIVVLSADHGEELRDHGGISHGSKLYDEQVRVPLIVDVPGVPPRRVPSPVELVDVVPTLLALLDVDAPEPLEPDRARGDDLRPELVGHAVAARPAFAAVARRRMVVRDGHKLIADLASGTYELYDLETDPAEREDLAASTDPTPWIDALHAWHDSLRPGPTGAPPTKADALALGRLEDDRAAPLLADLLGDAAALPAHRLEAARLLGDLGDSSSRAALAAALSDEAIALEAAIALATLGDRRAVPLLTRALETEAAARAAIALGRLGDRRAVPALIELLEAESPYDTKRDAIGALYRLRDPRAVPTLLAVTDDSQLRYRAITAIGLTESAEAFGPLAAMLASPRRTMIRDGLARALGWIGDPRAVPILAAMAARDAELIYVTEALVRLDAVQTPIVGGSDVGPGIRELRGLGRCHRGDPHDVTYRWHTWCEARASVEIPLGSPPDGPVVVALSARSLEADPIEIELTIGDRTLTARLEPEWAEHRFALESTDANLASLRPAGRAAIDHLLILSSAGAEQDPALDELGENRTDAVD